MDTNLNLLAYQEFVEGKQELPLFPDLDLCKNIPDSVIYPIPVVIGERNVSFDLIQFLTLNGMCVETEESMGLQHVYLLAQMLLCHTEKLPENIKAFYSIISTKKALFGKDVPIEGLEYPTPIYSSEDLDIIKKVFSEDYKKRIEELLRMFRCWVINEEEEKEKEKLKKRRDSLILKEYTPSSMNISLEEEMRTLQIAITSFSHLLIAASSQPNVLTNLIEKENATHIISLWEGLVRWTPSPNKWLGDLERPPTKETSLYDKALYLFAYEMTRNQPIFTSIPTEWSVCYKDTTEKNFSDHLFTLQQLFFRRLHELNNANDSTNTKLLQWFHPPSRLTLPSLNQLASVLKRNITINEGMYIEWTKFLRLIESYLEAVYKTKGHVLSRHFEFLLGSDLSADPFIEFYPPITSITYENISYRLASLYNALDKMETPIKENESLEALSRLYLKL